MVKKDDSNNKILKYLFSLFIFCLITFLFIYKAIDFNYQLVFMVMLIFLTYYMVIQFMFAGVIFVCLMYTIGFTFIAITSRFSEYHLNAVMAFQISIIISVLYLYTYVRKVVTSHTQLLNYSVFDDVTETYNKRYFNIKIDEELNISRTRNQKFSIMLIDIDKFKTINDTHGHLFGDEILKSFANEVKKNIRMNDTFCRFGGDEFTLLINNYSDDIFDLICNRIEQSVCLLNKKYSKEFEDPFSVSVGLSVFPDDSSDVREMIHYADKAMYKAKIIDDTSFVKFSVLN